MDDKKVVEWLYSDIDDLIDFDYTQDNHNLNSESIENNKKDL